MSVALWVAIGCAPASCLISSLHFALRDFSLRRLEELAKRNGGMGKLDPIVEDPEGYALSLGAVRVVLHVALVLAVFSWLAGDSGASAWTLVGAGTIAAAVVYIFGLVAPVSVATHAGEWLIHTFWWLIRGIHIVATPLRVVRFVDVAIRRLAGVHEVTEKEELEEELLDVVSEGEREGSLGESEREMIESVVELGSTTVDAIMTPRTEIEGIELTDDLREIREFILTAGHSRIPVWEGNPDHILGVLYVKDLLAYLGEDTSGFSLRPILRETLFVPESKPVNELMAELREKKIHMAIALDEYGGTAGLVTLEDVVEEIVGEIEDEYEPEDEAAPEIRVDEAARSAEIDGRVYLKDANDALESIGVELPESDDYDTVGGYVLLVFGHFPSVGERFVQNGHAVEVLEAEVTRVQRLRVEAREEESGERKAESGEPEGVRG